MTSGNNWNICKSTIVNISGIAPFLLIVGLMLFEVSR